MRPPDLPDPGSRRLCVLIIDDELDLCLLMRAYFLRKGYEVQVCHTLRDAVEQLDAFCPDFILLDAGVAGNEPQQVARLRQLAPGAVFFPC